jgi:hypothetical protein
LPSEVSYLGDISVTSGGYDDTGGVIRWWGAVASGEPVIVAFGAAVREHITTPQAIVNAVLLDDGLGNRLWRTATVIANGRASFLPVITKR